MGARGSGRIPSLDGLRGLAALTVVLGHARLIYLQNGTSDMVSEPGIGHASRAVGILGAHAVWLFFVLSGLVLTRMMLNAKDFDYGNYVLGRLARLYLPVWGAVVFTFVTVLAVGRSEPGLGQWVDNHPDTYSPGAMVYDLTLLAGPSGNISPLWSLQWEVLFSLLLILYVAVARWVPPWLAVVLSALACAAGVYVTNPVLIYMSMFAIGSGLAYAWDRLAATHDAVEAKIGVAASAVLAQVAVLGTLALQLLPMFGLDATSPKWAAVNMLVTMLAIAAAIVLIGLASSLRAVFESPVMHWLGVLSFSLYLIHEPVLLAFAYATRADTVWLVVALVACFPVAQVFYWGVEKPSHRVAQKIGKRGVPAKRSIQETATP